MIDRENWGSFPVDRATYPAKTGAAARPLNCRVKIPVNQTNTENTQLNPYFLSAGTPFSHREKTPSSVCQKERFTGLFEIPSSLHLHHTSWILPYAGPGQMGHHHSPTIILSPVKTAPFYTPVGEKKSLIVVFWQGL